MGGKWALWGTGTWGVGSLRQRPIGSLGKVDLQGRDRLVKAGTLELPPSQLGKHILETSGGLGRVKGEESGIQKGEESDSFLFPSLHLSRGLACPPSVLLGLGDPGPLGIVKSCHYPEGLRVRSLCWRRREGGQWGGRERRRLLGGEGSQAQIPGLLQLQSF